MAGPLQGIRIVDATSMIAGPLATMILGDQGADVIKVENPKGGDHSRQVAGRRAGWSASFLQNNRSKRSIALDLKREDGLEALRAILRTADVFVQNWRPGVADRLGLSEEAVRALRPDIVYVSIAGFGFEGDWADRPVYDPLIQALSGLAAVQGQGRGRPSLVRTIVPDKVTAIQTSQAITAALFARARTGRGDHVRLSMLDSVVAFLFASDFTGQTFIGDEAAEETWDEESAAQDYVELIYETADGSLHKVPSVKSRAMPITAGQGLTRHGTTMTNRQNVKSGDDRAADAHVRGRDYLGQPQVDRLLAAAKKSRHGIRDHLLVLMMFRHGLRVSEAIVLRRQDADLAQSRVWIARLKNGLSVEQPVAGNELRAIKRWLARREDGLPWLFISERKQPLTRQAVNYILGAAGTRADLGHVHPHMLRHSCGFALANKGRDLRLIQNYLGHRDPRHTAHYTRTAAHRFDDLWSK